MGTDARARSGAIAGIPLMLRQTPRAFRVLARTRSGRPRLRTISHRPPGLTGSLCRMTATFPARSPRAPDEFWRMTAVAAASGGAHGKHFRLRAPPCLPGVCRQPLVRRDRRECGDPRRRGAERARRVSRYRTSIVLARRRNRLDAEYPSVSSPTASPSRARPKRPHVRNDANPI